MHVDEVLLVFKDRSPGTVFVIFPRRLLLITSRQLISRFLSRLLLAFLNILIGLLDHSFAYVGVHHFR
jgi:hypothetical protein